MSKERDILKSLLLKEELELLDQLKQKLLSKKQFTEEVSAVLSNAIKRSQKKDPQLELALAIPIRNGVVQAFSESKQSIIDALLPIMGQLIRKTVTTSIKQFVTDINRTLELGFSAKALKWRWQALRSDSTFAEIVFQKTIRYQVSELFLINRNNGLLIEHAGADDMVKDNNAISAMLTAIQDFIGDSLQSPDADLLSADFGDRLLLISTGPKAYLASVIKGSPTERLKIKSQQLIENLHARFPQEILLEQNYRENPKLKTHLRKHLITKSLSEDSKKTNWWPWVLSITLLIAAASYLTYNRKQKLNNIIKLSDSISGFYLKSIERTWSGFTVNGLLDPLADISALKKEGITLVTEPFLSLDEKMVEQRVLKIVAPYKKVRIELHNKTLILSGLIPKHKSKDLLLQLTSLAGINSIKNQLTFDSIEKIESFLSHNNLTKHTDYILSDNKLSLVGEMKYKQHQGFLTQLNSLFPEIEIRTKELKISDSTSLLIAEINQTTINVPNFEAIDIETTSFTNLIQNLKTLNSRTSDMHISIIGKSDCTGEKSNEYSLLRAEAIKKTLLKHSEQHINSKLISTTIDPCETFTQDANNSLLGVTFNVHQK